MPKVGSASISTPLRTGQRQSKRHGSRRDERVDQGEYRGIDQESERLAEQSQCFGADRCGSDRPLDQPVDEVDRGANQRRAGGEAERVDEDAAREGAWLARTPDRIDFLFDLSHEQYRGDDDE